MVSDWPNFTFHKKTASYKIGMYTACRMTCVLLYMYVVVIKLKAVSSDSPLSKKVKAIVVLCMLSFPNK